MFQTFKKSVFIWVLVGAIIRMGIFMFGAHETHEDSNHSLYNCFHESPEHVAI